MTWGCINGGGGMRGPGIDSLSPKNSNKNSKNIFSHAPTFRVAADLIASRIPPGRAVKLINVDDMMCNHTCSR